MEDDIFQIIEDAITQRLTQTMSEASVIPYPDDPNEIGRPVRKTTVYVGIKGDSYDRPQTLNKRAATHQSGAIQIEILVKAVNLRTHRTAYPLRKQVEDSLAKFSPVPGDEQKWIYYRSGGLTLLDTGIWGLVMVYEFPHVKVTR